jgi:ABC-type amino acid transport substrate-binding protein
MSKLALFAAALLAVSINVQAKDWSTIRMATEGAYPPFNEVSSDGSVRGLDVDIGNALCAELKAQCVWVKQEWEIGRASCRERVS